MKKLFLFTLLFTTLFTNFSFGQVKTYTPGKFNQITVSPHIEIIFQQGTEEKIVVESITESISKFNVDLKNNKLHLYLDNAKITAKQEKKRNQNYEYSESIYKGTVAKVTLTYVSLKSLDLRGEEKFVFNDKIKQSDFSMDIYGNSDVIIKNAELSDLRVAIYGESLLKIENGNIDYQKFTAYGDSEINTLGSKNRITKITSYGEGVYKFNVKDKLQITSFGESDIEYIGNPEINKKIIIGETSIKQKNS